MKTRPSLLALLAAAAGLGLASASAQDSTEAVLAEITVTSPTPAASPAAAATSAATPAEPAVEPAVEPTATPAPTLAPLIRPGGTPSGTPAQIFSGTAERWRQQALSVEATQIIDEGQTVSSLSTVRGPVVVRGTVNGDLGVIDGDVYILGKVTGAVNVVSGKVYVLGDVDGRVNVVSGRIYKAGRIGGGTSVVNGSVTQASGATVTPHGNPPSRSSTINFDIDDEDLGGFFWSLVASTAAVLFRSLLGLMWLGLALLIAAIFPTAIEQASHAFLGREGPRSFAIGFLWKLAYWVFGIVFLIASFMLIGLPFLAVLLIFQWVLVMLGAAIVFLALGRWLLRLFGRTTPAFYTAIVTGGLLVTAFRMIPVLGDFVWWATAVLCSGVAIRQMLSLSGQPTAPTAPPASLPPAAA